ncbi:DUF2218 domain-containing protein [Sinorhizobium medicae]|nr:DUF2218 domain-containing protein [Sinorhizobium medicae]
MTETGGKYVLQLCKHFAHKIAVEQVDDCAELRFSCGTGYLKSAPDGLHIRVVSADDADLAQVQARHRRPPPAFRENAGPLHWTDF